MQRKAASGDYAGFVAALEAAFEPLRTTLSAFGNQHDLIMSHSFDIDPVAPHGAFFLGWRVPERRHQVIRVTDPLNPAGTFKIDVVDRFWVQEWPYSVSEGVGKLNGLLKEALLALNEHHVTKHL